MSSGPFSFHGRKPRGSLCLTTVQVIGTVVSVYQSCRSDNRLGERGLDGRQDQK